MRRHVMVLNWLMIPTAVGILVLLVLTLMGWPRVMQAPGGGLTDTDAAGLHPAPQHARQFFGWASTVSWRPLTNSANPFFTLAIQPPPPPTPPPPPPATRRVDVTYRGFFETSARVRRALIQVADKQVMAAKGDKLLADYGVVEIELRHLGLTNGAGAAVKLEFSKPMAIEVPANK